MDYLKLFVDNASTIAQILAAVGPLVWALLRVAGMVRVSYKEWIDLRAEDSSAAVAAWKESKIEDIATAVATTAEYWGRKKGWNGAQKLAKALDKADDYMNAIGLVLDSAETILLRIKIDQVIAEDDFDPKSLGDISSDGSEPQTSVK